MIYLHDNNNLSQQVNILTKRLIHDAGDAHWNIAPIFYIQNQTISIGGVINEGRYIGSHAGDFRLKFNDDREIYVPNVFPYHFHIGLQVHENYKVINKKHNDYVFEEGELLDADIYIVSLTSNTYTTEKQICALHIYHGPELIETINNIGQQIIIFGKMKLGYTCYTDMKQESYTQMIYDNGNKKAIATTKEGIFSGAYYEQKEASLTENNYVIERASKVHLYFHIDGSRASIVFRAFCTTADEFEQISNYLPDDDTQNYHAAFSISRLDDIAFAEYCLTKGNYCGIAIYNYPLQSYLAAITPEDYPMSTESWLFSQEQIESFKEIIVSVFEHDGENYAQNRLPVSFPKTEYTHIAQMRSLRNWLNCHHAAYIDAHKQPNRAKAVSYNQLSEAYNQDNLKIRTLRARFRDKYTELAQNLTLSGELKTKWISEYKLFQMVFKEYSDAIYQYHVNWLGHQSLDIYLPSLNIGIEYQGVQHYHPVDFFGGAEGLKTRLLLDEKKRNLCAENGIKLIEWHYNDRITKFNLEKKINALLKSDIPGIPCD